MASSSTTFAIATLLFAALFAPAANQSSPGSFCPTSLFTFADSLSDGGNRDIEGGGKTLSGSYPYGVTYGRPTGRYCDGLIIPDFLVQKLGFDNIGIPSLEFNGTEFVSLNFAYAGATVLQVDDFVRHQQTVVARNGREQSEPWYENALFYVEIGGDDINFALPLGTDTVINHTIPAVIQGLASGIATLYNHGARHVLLFNMPRADCSPNYLQAFQQYPATTTTMVALWRSRLATVLAQNYTGLNVYYYDWFAANTYVMENMNQYGFTNALQSCCGGGGKFNCNGDGLCGCAPLNEPNAIYTVCNDPSRYFTFDGIHYTQHFYQIMSDFIIAGQYLTPSVKLQKGCKAVNEPEEIGADHPVNYPATAQAFDVFVYGGSYTPGDSYSQSLDTVCSFLYLWTPMNGSELLVSYGRGDSVVWALSQCSNRTLDRDHCSSCLTAARVRIDDFNTSFPLRGGGYWTTGTNYDCFLLYNKDPIHISDPSKLFGVCILRYSSLIEP
ncbi:hypothetical protein SELMODRAFT_411531 [Selaginella moellendorffii]|uniref:Gnk2-homologous domain-containing protein n=1 Tax=Selaginella moellendorffii TaxID=88036 RepID=D8RI85_SELML|nr:hypothetical protein SELMODRAFT_411531 [Selaginella moellendorffii]